MITFRHTFTFLHCMCFRWSYSWTLRRDRKEELCSDCWIWLSEVFWWQLLSAARGKTDLCPFHFVWIEEVLGNMLSGAKWNWAKGSITSLCFISDKLSGSVILTVWHKRMFCCFNFSFYYYLFCDLHILSNDCCWGYMNQPSVFTLILSSRQFDCCFLFVVIVGNFTFPFLAVYPIYLVTRFSWKYEHFIR